MKTFLTNTSGQAGLILGLSAVPLLLSAGLAIDYARVLNTETFLQAIADESVIAGTKELLASRKDLKAIEVAATHFKSALAQRDDIKSDEIKFVVNNAGTGVNAIGKAQMETTFGKIIGIEKMDLLVKEDEIVAAAVGGNAGVDLEISLVLDVTGSMCNDGVGPCSSGTKLTAMRDAANDLVDTVMLSRADTKVAVVPFNSHIRIAPDGQGADIMARLSNIPARWSGYKSECFAYSGVTSGTEGAGTANCTDIRQTYYSNLRVIPCVADRFTGEVDGDFDYSDDAPGNNKWLNAHDGTRFPISRDSSNKPFTTALGATAADATGNHNHELAGRCVAQPEANQLLPLTTSKSKVKDRINSLVGVRWTGGPLGMAFGWYTLSPEWNSILESDEDAASYSNLTKPNSATGRTTRKVVIFLSDGAFNSVRGWVANPYIERISKGAVDICTAMKAKGIEIYTVGFDLDNVAADERKYALSSMAACGSTVDHFYQSINAAELQNAFDDIGAKVVGSGSIRLVN